MKNITLYVVQCKYRQFQVPNNQNISRRHITHLGPLLTPVCEEKGALSPLLSNQDFPSIGMTSKSRASRTTDEPFWATTTKAAGRRRKKGEKHFPIVDYLREKHQQLEELVAGPGAGAGVGCGAGIGLGVAGGLGVGGWPWDQLKLVFGVGIGCGLGIGVGYGIGIGYGLSMESMTKQKPDAGRRILTL